MTARIRSRLGASMRAVASFATAALLAACGPDVAPAAPPTLTEASSVPVAEPRADGAPARVVLHGFARFVGERSKAATLQAGARDR